ncbi:hypothetical protein [Caulobacter segnis]|uniref:Uncharacterized protein n=1 Tax=Caulobacter segnis TaxID=88688 RepID=A0A2W5XB19_9CAUL|nr:hypothetical protein [Caulobacter segnis]PZR34401.1 MAG: hypothetical protein DI526_10360 [Caulobacter segnis]
MAELSGASEDQAEDIAAFRAALSKLGEDHRRVLQVLFPRIAALQERGDTDGALALVAKIKAILSDPERRPQ